MIRSGLLKGVFHRSSVGLRPPWLLQRFISGRIARPAALSQARLFSGSYRNLEKTKGTSQGQNERSKYSYISNDASFEKPSSSQKSGINKTGFNEELGSDRLGTNNVHTEKGDFEKGDSEILDSDKLGTDKLYTSEILAKQTITKEQLLSRANSVLSRLGVRFKWLLKRSNRPLNTDDYSALFSWLVVGNVFFLILGTTTFVSLIIFTINPIFSQEFVARKVGEIMTENSKLDVTFEHAIVPGWRDGKISFKKCFVSRRPKLIRTFAKGSQADAYARSQGSGDCVSEEFDDGNYTQFDLTIEEVNVSFSFRKWMNGTGIIDTIEINGLRGIVDRTHVHWDPDDDATNYKNKYQFGDFEINAFVMKDVLFTLLQPAGFRPFKVAIYNCELSKLRKHWLFYDFLNANNMSGSYDNSLFTIHKRQRLNDFDLMSTDETSKSPWKRVTRLRVDSLSVDHLNKGLEGPFGWITSGKVDMVGDVMVPEEARDLNVSEIVTIIAESIHKEATRYRNPDIHITRQDSLARLCSSVPSEGDEVKDVSKFFVLDLKLRLNNVRASVPFQAPELSYVNYALIRPIVAYINSRNAFIEIHSRVVKNLDDFSGSWTVYDSLLMEDISEQVYDSFVNYVADDERRLARMRKMAFWSVQVLVQLIVFGLGALT